MTTTIVFGSKLDEASASIGDVAGRLATKLGARLRVVHVAEDARAPFVLGTDEEHLLGPARGELTAETRRISAATGAKVEPHLAAGPVVDALSTVAEWESAMLVVVGVAGTGSRHPLGAISERLARQSRAPVLALRESAPFDRWLRGEAGLRVLVGADLGRASKEARAFAERLASLGSTEVDVVMVASPAETHERLGLGPWGNGHELHPDAQASLLRDLGREVPEGGERARIRIIAGRAAADAHLIALADEEGVDLIVVGQRQQSLLGQLWHGSVARGVVRSAPMSVVCVPPTSEPTRIETPAINTVIVGTDFSDGAERALAVATGLVRSGGTLHVVHVAPAIARGLEAMNDARTEGWRRLQQLVAAVARRDLELEHHLLEGDPTDELVAVVERLGADLVVVGSRGQNRLSRLLLGSVARGLAERLNGPLLLVPPSRP